MPLDAYDGSWVVVRARLLREHKKRRTVTRLLGVSLLANMVLGAVAVLVVEPQQQQATSALEQSNSAGALAFSGEREPCPLFSKSSLLEPEVVRGLLFRFDCTASDIAEWNALQRRLAHRFHQQSPPLVPTVGARVAVAVSCERVLGLCTLPNGRPVAANALTGSCGDVACVFIETPSARRPR